jgi:hypothetical protein
MSIEHEADQWFLNENPDYTVHVHRTGPGFSGEVSTEGMPQGIQVLRDSKVIFASSAPDSATNWEIVRWVDAELHATTQIDQPGVRHYDLDRIDPILPEDIVESDWHCVGAVSIQPEGDAAPHYEVRLCRRVNVAVKDGDGDIDLHTPCTQVWQAATFIDALHAAIADARAY